MRIHTLPVYSKLADEAEVPPEVAARLPQGWQLSQHQVETYRALTQGDAHVIFNTAMTGDGKSLAGQLPALIHGGQASALMAMYPTNELVYDQRGQLAGAAERWKSQVLFEPLDAAALDAVMMEGFYTQRGDALLDVLQNNDVVLTNPDILHLIMHQFYVRPSDASDKIIGPMMQRIRQFTFDEFHIFETPQVVSVLNALLFIHEVAGSAREHKFLFLSATPNDLMREYLERSGLTVQSIEGVYMHGEAQPDPARWRRILHETTIHVDTGRVEEWVEAHLEDTLLPFFLERRPRAKGAIIVNSVASAYRLLARLQPTFEEHSLTVEPNTGLTSRERRRASYEADLLIGTSTVDVGVDFQINFLLFESRDAGSFTQRLGRLGRHNGYERDATFYPFDDFAAWALVPPWIQESLFVGRDGEAPLLEHGATVDRQSLDEAIQAGYPPTARFDKYAQRWGKLQSVRIMVGLSDATIREQYTQSRVRLGQRYEATFGIRLRSAFGYYRELRHQQRKLLDEVTSFRGGSYFVCGIVDDTERDQVKTADLFLLVANARLGPLAPEEFDAAVEEAGIGPKAFESRHNPVAFFRMYGWRPDRAQYRLRLDRDIRDWGAERFGQATLIKGWQLDAAVPDLVQVNRRLSRRELPALLCLGYHPLELKRRLRLPLLFALHAFVSRDGVDGCVAFGREALLLETRLQYTPLPAGGSAILL